MWAGYNRDYFAGVLVPPYLLLDEPSEPATLGQYAPAGGLIRQPQIMIRPSLLAGTHPGWPKPSEIREPGQRTIRVTRVPVEYRRRLVADVLLHECIHQWQHETTEQTEDSYHGHGPGFRDKANEIGARLGLPPVRTGKKRGPDRDLPSCSYWPHIVRPGEHYGRFWQPAGRHQRDHVATIAAGLRSAYAATVAATAADEPPTAVDLAPLVELADEIREQLSQLAGTHTE
jgi:hypothetical protein